ncbi:MAG: hypothetical protein J6W52_04955 [Bacteroidaceae bacterium]|nr:hypothetical protein [Bacteroidaceae bacterium]
MKKTKFLFLLFIFNVLCSIFNELRAQDAFYIYRNDGQFDGFFYDEVVRMGYSKLGLDSIEYDAYVVQEIETEDSLYRIPLAAIDSVGFQQPEIRLNPKFRNLDEMKLTQFVTRTYSDPNRSYIELYIPDLSELRPGDSYWWEDFEPWEPEEGDVIGGFDESVFGEGGYCMKVSHVVNFGSGHYILDTQPIEGYGDVFDQFITIERLYVDKAGNVRRRIAGCNEDGTPNRARKFAESGKSEEKLIDFSSNISREWEPKEGVNIDLGADISMSLGLRVTYNCSWSRIYVKFEVPADFSLTPKVTVKASTSFEGTVGGLPKFLKSIKFPMQIPIFQTLPLPEFVIRGGGTLSASVSFPSVGFGVQQNLVFDSNVGGGQYWWSKSTTGSDADPSVVDIGKGEVALEGFIQAALKLSANIETCDWFSNLFFCHVGLDLYVGPKIDGTFSLSTDMFDGISPNSSIPYYTFKNSGVSITGLSCDLEAKGMLGYLFKDKEERSFLSASLPLFKTSFNMIPSFDSFKVQGLPSSLRDNGSIKATFKTSGRTFLPTYLGIAYTGGKEVEYAYSSHFFDSPEKETTVTVGRLYPGAYTVKPYFKTFGFEYRADPKDEKDTTVYVMPTTITHARVRLGIPTKRSGRQWGYESKWDISDGSNRTEYDDPLDGESGVDIDYSFIVSSSCSNGRYIITGEQDSNPDKYSQEQLRLRLVIDASEGTPPKVTEVSLTRKSQSNESHSSGSASDGFSFRSSDNYNYEYSVSLNNVSIPITGFSVGETEVITAPDGSMPTYGYIMGSRYNDAAGKCTYSSKYSYYQFYERRDYDRYSETLLEKVTVEKNKEYTEKYNQEGQYGAIIYLGY